MNPASEVGTFTREDILKASDSYANLIVRVGLSRLCAMGYSQVSVSPWETLHELPTWERAYLLSDLRESLSMATYAHFVQRVAEACAGDFLPEPVSREMARALAKKLGEPPLFLGDQWLPTYPRGEGKTYYNLQPVFAFNGHDKSVKAFLLWGSENLSTGLENSKRCPLRLEFSVNWKFWTSEITILSQYPKKSGG